MNTNPRLYKRLLKWKWNKHLKRFCLRKIKWLIRALGLLLFPNLCACCGTPLVGHHWAGMCSLCIEQIEGNDDKRCQRCDLPQELMGALPSTSLICPACQIDPPCFNALRAPFIYGGSIADTICRAKFGGDESGLRKSVEILLTDMDVIKLLSNIDVIVPIPLGKKRQVERGFNQSAVIANELSKGSGISVGHFLRRTVEHGRQSSLGLTARKSNVEGVFSLPNKIKNGMHVALIDDVVTSTYTVRSAAKTLLDGGAAQVVVIAMARSV